MGIEIERKFIVKTEPNLSLFTPDIIMQGYFLAQDGYTIRVRRISTPCKGGTERGSLAAKGPLSGFGRRQEEEVFFDDAAFAGSLLKRCQLKVLKRRYSMPDTWVIDVFDWDNEGLVIAELEGGHEIYSAPTPEGFGREITGVPEFSNERLALRPWTRWTEEERQHWLTQ